MYCSIFVLLIFLFAMNLALIVELTSETVEYTGRIAAVLSPLYSRTVQSTRPQPGPQLATPSTAAQDLRTIQCGGSGFLQDPDLKSSNTKVRVFNGDQDSNF